MQHAIRIDDAADPRVAPYLSIRDRDLAGREGRFVAEGKVVLRMLFEARRFEPESVLVLENRLAGLTSVLDAAPSSLPVYVAGQAVMDAIAGFHIHRGVLAIGRRGPPLEATSLLNALPEQALVLALVGISNHDNVGAIFRNAAAFGADAVLLDATCCDPLYRKAIRVSVGAALKVPFAVAADGTGLLAALSQAGFSSLALSPSGRIDIGGVTPARRTALFLGTEGEGLPQELMRTMQTVRIPIARDFDSLNVAAASAIALHRLARI